MKIQGHSGKPKAMSGGHSCMDPLLKVTYKISCHFCSILAHTGIVSSEKQNKTQNSSPSLHYSWKTSSSHVHHEVRVTELLV